MTRAPAVTSTKAQLEVIDLAESVLAAARAYPAEMTERDLTEAWLGQFEAATSKARGRACSFRALARQRSNSSPESSPHDPSPPLPDSFFTSKSKINDAQSMALSLATSSNPPPSLPSRSPTLFFLT